jgi:DNA-binding CsgD family transcriptional regulator
VGSRGITRRPSDKPPSPPSVRLRLRDVRAIFRLVGRIRELGADPTAWRPHLVRSLSKLLRAEIVTSSEVHFRKAKEPGVMRVLDIGWGTDSSGTTWAFRTEQDNEQPETYMLALGQTPAGVNEGDAVHVQPVQPITGGKSFILSQYPLPHISAVDQLGVHRAWGEQPFTAAEHRLLQLFHAELGRLWKRDMLHRAKDPHIDLPPRLQQTLDALADGQSEKQIAVKLKLSQHTIHNYVKALHQRFGVSSRGELLARVNREKADFTPRLSVPPGD